MEWNEDLSVTKISPGLDDWRQQKYYRFPENSLGKLYRRRSRSPHDFKWESGLNDRSTESQTCKDFAVGRCRRGDHCPFLHQNDKYFENMRYSEGGASRVVVSDDMLDHPLHIGTKSWVHPLDSDRTIQRSERENWLRDMKEMSPEWNYRFPSSNHTSKEEPICHQINLTSHSQTALSPLISPLLCEDKKATRYGGDLSAIDLNLSAASVPPSKSLDQIGPSSRAFTQSLSGLNTVGPNQQAFAVYVNTNTQTQQQFQEDKVFSTSHVGFTKRSQVISELPSSQNTVSTEQLSQLSNFLAHLSRLLETGQTLPQLYAALNGSNTATGSQNQYNPINASIDMIKSNPVIGEEKPEMLFPPSVTKDDENKEIAVEDKKKGQESGPVETMDGADESKNGKGIRAFKFALVEFVKELLKPKWREGQISKEAHKTIVKKVVDKVIGSVQRVHMPQSREEIYDYLSSSKPKLFKLVQAYVEIYQKS